MPFYEYECSGCGHHLEAMQKISDGPLKKCPACSRNALIRLMSAPVFRLKGGGWYETDFKGEKDNKRNLAGEKDDAAKPAEASADKAADTKPEKPAAEASPGKAAAGASTGRTRVPIQRPAARKPAAATRKPAARKPPAKARGARRAP